MARNAYERDVVDRDVAVERNDIRGVAGINFILGIWLIIAPWVLSYLTTSEKWDSVAIGIAVLVLSAIRYILPSQVWASWFNGIIGIWLIISPFVLNTIRTAAYWNDVIVGIVIAILAFSNMQYYGRHHYGSTA